MHEPKAAGGVIDQFDQSQPEVDSIESEQHIDQSMSDVPASAESPQLSQLPVSSTQLSSEPGSSQLDSTNESSPATTSVDQTPVEPPAHNDEDQSSHVDQSLEPQEDSRPSPPSIEPNSSPQESSPDGRPEDAASFEAQAEPLLVRDQTKHQLTFIFQDSRNDLFPHLLKNADQEFIQQLIDLVTPVDPSSPTSNRPSSVLQRILARLESIQSHPDLAQRADSLEAILELVQESIISTPQSPFA